MGDKSPKQQSRNAQQKKNEKAAKEEARRSRTPQSPGGDMQAKPKK
ncbi:hypothetical protein [Sandaracinus amylolyticus]|nr:hypothetical protein [Sandaracinus amylolyticus]UJR82569.1 Hypothetical protein I5071_46340 [Sandaracinus amylolyticus]